MHLVALSQLFEEMKISQGGSLMRGPGELGGQLENPHDRAELDWSSLRQVRRAMSRFGLKIPANGVEIGRMTENDGFWYLGAASRGFQGQGIATKQLRPSSGAL